MRSEDAQEEEEVMEQERIVAAAVRTKGFFNDHRMVWSVSPPGRHCDLLTVGDRRVREEMEQGFVTNTGRFVDRVEAWRIAAAAGQIKHRAGSDGPDAGLTSESVW